MNTHDFSANRIKELREENALTQHELSRKTGISQANISRWEKNVIIPNVLDCWKLAEFFNVSVDYLIGREDD
ncbi:MAG: helix-turn-helix transcriptional regulator [Bacteroides sp.]|nr:helix-turn-helix transcriptional regulator [Bacillota bacterium]MCM1394051.1 helix-turn-helix transcriptional regulator [[Eubacterium] siraeum]MCM1455503.1 helix-turn-helix transcriptional regulator [Bacteroides sp.]